MTCKGLSCCGLIVVITIDYFWLPASLESHRVVNILSDILQSYKAIQMVDIHRILQGLNLWNERNLNKYNISKCTRGNNRIILCICKVKFKNKYNNSKLLLLSILKIIMK